MEVENQNPLTSIRLSQEGSSSSIFHVLPRENCLTHHITHLGTVIPNRIFVGGIDSTVNESDLRHFFSQHGAVKEVKIVIDRSGLSRGYGFVTFETQEDALKILHDANGICFKDKKLSIGQAVRKQKVSGQIKTVHVVSPGPAMPVLMSFGTFYLTTSKDYPYTDHNGVTYFHCPSVSPPVQHWPPAPPGMLPQLHQPVYQRTAYHHYQCVPNHYQCPVAWSPLPSSPVMYSQQPKYLYQPTEGGSVPSPLPVMEETTAEFVDPTVQHFYPVYPSVALQHNPGKNRMFPHSQNHCRPKYHGHLHHKDCQYLPEAPEPPDASMQPLM